MGGGRRGCRRPRMQTARNGVARVLSKGYFRKVSVDEVPVTPARSRTAPATTDEGGLGIPQRDLGDDPLAMRALAHPLRLRLLEELTLRGPLTATRCADLVGESPSS